MSNFLKGLVLGFCFGLILSFSFAEYYTRQHSDKLLRKILHEELAKMTTPKTTIKSAVIYMTAEDFMIYHKSVKKEKTKK